MKAKKITLSALLVSLAIIFGYVENLIPIPIPVPGIKLGLSNFVLLFAIDRLPAHRVFLIMLLKTFVSALLFAGMTAFIYSFAGGVLSLLVMYAAKRFCSWIGISAAGGAAHNSGQLLAAFVILKNSSVFYYLPFLLIGGAGFGCVLGAAAISLFPYLKKNGGAE